MFWQNVKSFGKEYAGCLYFPVILGSIIGLMMYIGNCNSEKKASEKENNKKEYELLKIKNDAIFKYINSTYKPSYNWDTLSYDFSRDYLDVINSEYQLISDFEINDIKYKDSLCYVSVYENYKYYFDLILPKGEITVLNKYLSSPELHDIVFVVKIKSIEKREKMFSDDNDFIGEGDVIKIYLTYEIPYSYR